MIFLVTIEIMTFIVVEYRLFNSNIVRHSNALNVLITLS